jgi:eukaryotic-like serine/threonine-protein kinase
MAAVYAATHRNGQRVAIKILHTKLSSDDGVRERFLREGHVTNAVNHPACVTVMDDGITEHGAPFLVMELLHGQTLRELWKRKGRRLAPIQALLVLDPVLDCLSACHGVGVIHRDLKPPNIFLTRSGGVKVLDFGVAQLRTASTEKTRAGTALGTPHYMSPEQAMGLVDELDGRADLFSVGAILHALITGQRIHQARTENEALILAGTSPVASVARIAPELPIELIALIDKALAWDRRNRYADAREMQAALRDALSKLGVAVGSIGAGWAAQDMVPTIPPVSERTPVPSAAPRGAPQEQEVADEQDPRVVGLRDLFKQTERMLSNVRSLGWEHPATERTLHTLFQAFVDALSKSSDGVSFTCRPYSLVHLGQTVWEPSAPLDVIPYNLFECGIRAMRLVAGLTLDEFQQTLKLWLVDPARELAPEDDLAAALWDRGLVHVQYETAEAFAEGDAGDREVFYDEADELERYAAQAAAARANAAEARAMALSTDRSALHAQLAQGPMALDEAVRTSLADQFNVTRKQWSERYVEVLADALLNATARGDLDVLTASLRKSATDLVVSGRLGVVLALRKALIETLSPRMPEDQLRTLRSTVTDAVMGAEALTVSIEHLHTHVESVGEFGEMLLDLGAQELPVILSGLRAGAPSALREIMLGYIERAIPHFGAEIAGSIAKVEPGSAPAVLALLRKAGTATAMRTLAELTKSEDPNMRIEARILGADSTESLQLELGRLCTDGSMSVRMAAYRAVARHVVRPAAPAIVRQIKSAAFNTLDVEERKQLFVSLLVLSPERGEEMALEVARKSGLVTSEARELSRVAAIDALSELSRSREAADALREISRTRWGTSGQTREHALAAATAIDCRVSSPSQEMTSQ